jgi:peptide deformylase
MREIVYYPNPILLKKCKAIDEESLKAGVFDGMNLAELVADMTRILFSTRSGVGLAAPQVGVDARLFIMNQNRANPVIVVVNPVLSSPEGEIVQTEGCLSMPGIEARVRRPQLITLNAQHIDGRPFSMRATGLMARVIQHETDHLDGVLFTNRLGLTSRQKIQPKLDKLEREFERWEARKNRQKPGA